MLTGNIHPALNRKSPKAVHKRDGSAKPQVGGAKDIAEGMGAELHLCSNEIPQTNNGVGDKAALGKPVMTVRDQKDRGHIPRLCDIKSTWRRIRKHAS